VRNIRENDSNVSNDTCCFKAVIINQAMLFDNGRRNFTRVLGAGPINDGGRSDVAV